MNRFRGLAAGAAAVVAGLTASASAQFGALGGFTDLMKPDWTGRDLPLIAQRLDLDESQRVIAESFYEDYHAKFQNGLDAMRSQFESEELRTKIQDVAGDQEKMLELIFAPLSDWRQSKEALSDEFETNLQLILSERQVEQWPAFERFMRRQKELPNAEFSGERLDLLAVIRDMHLEAPVQQSIQPLLHEYELALDAALQARQAVVESQKDNMTAWLQQGQAAEGLPVVEKHVARRVAIRDLNLNYINRISEALPSDLATTFHRTAMEEAFPSVHQDLRALTVFDAARALDTVTSEQRAEIDQIEQRLLAALAPVNQRLVQAILAFEPAEAMHKARSFVARQSGERIDPIENPSRDVMQERDEVVRAHMEQLQALLTPEVFATLPGARRYMPPDDDAVRARRAAERAERLRSSGRRGLRSGDRDRPRTGGRDVGDRGGRSDRSRTGGERQRQGGRSASDR